MNAIIAVDNAGGMGFQGRMAWPRVPGDLARFARLTRGQTVIMGRGTFESTDMPVPLPDRFNIVLSSTIAANRHGVVVAPSVDCLPTGSDVWVIGGAGALVACWPLVNHVELTRVHGEWPADTVFDFALLAGFTLRFSDRYSTHTFETWTRDETVS